MATRGRRPDLADGYNPKTGEWAEGSKGAKILDALRIGNFQTHAAGYAGVSDRALANWLSRGRHYLDQQPDADPFDMKQVPKNHRMYVHFVQAFTRARSNSVVELMTLMRGAARDDWRAAARLLEMIDPENFRPAAQRLEHSGPGGGPMRTSVTGVETALGPLLGARREKASQN
jgi:hypothetical protein